MPQALAAVIQKVVVSEVLAQIIAVVAVNYALSRVSRMLMSPPPDAVEPSAELRALFLRQAPHVAQADGVRVDCFEGFVGLHSGLEINAAVGECMAPLYPNGSAFFCDSSLPVRSGDLAAIEDFERVEPQPREGRLISGMRKRELVRRAKWAQLVGDRWVLHSVNEPEYLMPSTARFAGRVVAAVALES